MSCLHAPWLLTPGVRNGAWRALARLRTLAASGVDAAGVVQRTTIPEPA
jgi:hypothetical protein